MLLASILLASLLGGVLSVIVAGFLLKGLPHYWLPRMVGFSAGLLLGAAMLSVLPEAYESGADAHTLFTVLLAGFIGFYAPRFGATAIAPPKKGTSPRTPTRMAWAGSPF